MTKLLHCFSLSIHVSLDQVITRICYTLFLYLPNVKYILLKHRQTQIKTHAYINYHTHKHTDSLTGFCDQLF